MSDQTLDLSVILPSFRNAALAARSVEELAAYLTAQGLRWEIVVVDDGGGDFTETPRAAGGDVRFVGFPENRGKGAAVRAGMLAARGECRVFTDVDLPFQLSAFPLTVEYLLQRRFHLVVGDRTLPDSRYTLDIGWQRRLASFGFSQFASKLVTGGFFDTQCGFKGFRGDVAVALFSRAIIDRFAFDVEILYLALRHRLDIKRIPMVLRNNETSSVRLGRDSARMLWDVFRIKAHQVAGHYRDQELQDLLSGDHRQDQAIAQREIGRPAVTANRRR